MYETFLENVRQYEGLGKFILISRFDSDSLWTDEAR